MDRKGSSRTVAVESVQVARALSRETSLSAEEERTVRMRHGAGVELTAPLMRAAGTNTELADELMLMEMQLLRSFKARAGVRTAAASPTVSASRTKDKIVRALRKKK